MSEETKPTEQVPTIEVLFDAFCKQHGVMPVVVAVGPVTGTPIPVIDLMVTRLNIQIQFVKPQG